MPFRGSSAPTAAGEEALIRLRRQAQSLTQARGTLRLSGDGLAQDCFQGKNGHGLSGPGQSGVKKLAGEQGRFAIRQDHQHMLELRALALVDGHGIGRFVRRQAFAGYGPNGIRFRREVNQQAGFLRPD